MLAILRSHLEDCASGRIPPNLALYRLLASSPDEDSARAALAEYLGSRADHERPIRAIAELWARLPEAYARVQALKPLEMPVVQGWQTSFDQTNAIDEQIAVAAYCLGDADLLKSATNELVSCVQAWDLLGGDVLDFGCGTGRVAAAIAPLVAHVTGIDVSQRMVEAARHAVRSYPNAVIIRGEETSLPFGAGQFDAVLAVDSFPYVVGSGVADRVLADMARVLKAEGRLLIMNYSYRGDLELDRCDVSAFARHFGFTVLRDGTADLSLWDGRAFLLQKAGQPATATG